MLEHRGGEKTFNTLKRLGIIGGVAAGWGFLNPRFAAPGDDAARIFNVPADATVGLGLLALGLTGYFGAESEHVLDISYGCLAAYGYRRLQRLSRERLSIVQEQPTQQVRGTLGPAPVRGNAWPYNTSSGMAPSSSHQPQYAWSP
jgi:hypothetical protein